MIVSIRLGYLNKNNDSIELNFFRRGEVVVGRSCRKNVSGSKRKIKISIIPPPIVRNQKIHLHPKYSTIYPPITGPIIGPINGPKQNIPYASPHSMKIFFFKKKIKISFFLLKIKHITIKLK